MDNLEEMAVLLVILIIVFAVLLIILRQIVDVNTVSSYDLTATSGAKYFIIQLTEMAKTPLP